MAKTSRDARRHIKEWSEFFADGKVVAEVLVDEFIRRYKKRKYLRQSLKRLVEKGFIQKSGNKFIPTLSGRYFFRRQRKVAFENKGWGGKWYIVSFDVPVEFNSKRNILRQVLKTYNFYQLQKSVWIGSDKIGKELWEFIVRNDLDEYCKLMIVDFLEGDKEIKRHFKIFT